MKNKVLICASIELDKSTYVKKWIEDWKDEIIIFKKDNKIKLFSSICPHFGGEIVYDNKLMSLKCLWHDWKFCSKSGKCLSHPIRGKLNPYDFEINPQPLKSYEIIESTGEIYAIKK